MLIALNLGHLFQAKSVILAHNAYGVDIRCGLCNRLGYFKTIWIFHISRSCDGSTGSGNGLKAPGKNCYLIQCRHTTVSQYGVICLWWVKVCKGYTKLSWNIYIIQVNKQTKVYDIWNNCLLKWIRNDANQSKCVNQILRPLRVMVLLKQEHSNQTI